MSLDLNQLAAQIDGMAASLKAEEENWKGCLGRALEILHLQSADLDSLRRKIESSKTSWLVAGVSVQLVGSLQPPPCPPDFAVIASDGSHIDVDRHSPARCYLINIGSATLLYGQDPDAILCSQPALYASKQDLTIADPLGSGEQSVEGGLLGIKRAVAECLALAELGEELSPEFPAVALLDGSLIMWGLAGHAYPEYVRTELLENSFLPALDRIKEVSQKTGLALASYVSLPRSTDVVNALRVAICPMTRPTATATVLEARPHRRESVTPLPVSGIATSSTLSLSQAKGRQPFSAVLLWCEITMDTTRSASFTSRPMKRSPEWSSRAGWRSGGSSTWFTP